MTSSDQYDVRGLANPVGIWMERTTVDQLHSHTHRYPKALMSNAGVSVREFTVNLGVEVSGKPESDAASRWVFEQVCNAVKDCITGLNQGHVPDSHERHCSSSCCGEGAATPGDPSVGGSGRAGVDSSATPARKTEGEVTE